MKKRPAAALPQPLVKRPATASSVAEDAALKVQHQCDDVAAALLASPDFPVRVLRLLTSGLPGSLGSPREDRHAFQDEVARMVGDVLSKSEEALRATVREVTAKRDEVQAQRAERQRAEEEALQAVRDREAAMDAALQVAQGGFAGLVAARAALAAAEAELAAGQQAVAAAEARRELLRSTQRNTYLPIKEGTADPGKVQQGLATMVSVGRDCSFDLTLLESAPFAAAKAPSDRGNFDIVVLKQLDTEFERCAVRLEESIVSAEHARKEREARVVAAFAEVERARSAEQELRAPAEAARAALKEASVARRAASKVVQQCAPELKRATAELDSARARLAEFRSGPLATYKALLDRTLLAPAPARARAADPEAEAAPAG